MKLKNLIPVLLVLLSGCVERHNGPELSEPGEVYDTCFVPKGHGHDVAVGYNAGKRGGVTITPVNINIPARFAVVFKCQHGKFVIDGPRGERLYKKLSKGDRVVIRYCEVLEVKDGITTPVELHFIDANVSNDKGTEALEAR